MKCPYCSQDIADGSDICPICGKPLNGNAETTAPDTAEIPAAADAPIPAEEVENTGSTAAPGAEAEAAESAAAPEVESAAGAAAPESESAAVPEEESALASGTDVPEAPLEAGGQAQKSGKKKWVLPVAVAAVVAVAAGAFAMSNRKDPKDIVIDAFKSITAEGQTNPSEEIFGSKELAQKLNKESSEFDIEFTVEGSSDPTIAQLATGKLGMSVLNDVENKKMSLAAGVGYADMNLVNLEFYLDDKQAVMAVPELSSKAFTLNYADDLEGQVKHSPFVGQIFEESGLDITGLNGYLQKCSEIASTGEPLINVSELWKRYKEGSKAIDDLKAAMTVEKAEKQSFTIDGKEESCNGYHAVVTKDALIQFITTTKEFFLNDETLKSEFVDYMELVMQLQSSMAMYMDPSIQTPEEMQQWIWNEAETQMDSVIEQLKTSMGDVTMDVYVRKNGKMAGFNYETTAVIDEEDVKLYGDVKFGGGYNMMSNVLGILNIEDSTGETVTITIDKSGVYESGKTWTGALNASLSNGDDSYSVAYTGNYGVAEGTYDMKMDLLAGDESQFTVTSNGMVNNLVKGESFDLYMDSIKLTTPLLTGDDQYIELSGKYLARPLEQTVAVPEGETFDILAATEDDYNTVGEEIMGKAFALMMKLYQ